MNPPPIKASRGQVMPLSVALLFSYSQDLERGEEGSDVDEAEITAEMIDVIKTISDQDFHSDQAMTGCEEATINPWQSLDEHRPLGGINPAKRAVYSEAGEFRIQQNSS